MKIYIRCPKCDTYHNLRVIKLFSNFKKHKFVVWCWKKLKFDTLYYID